MNYEKAKAEVIKFSSIGFLLGSPASCTKYGSITSNSSGVQYTCYNVAATGNTSHGKLTVSCSDVNPPFAVPTGTIVCNPFTMYLIRQFR